MPAADCTDEDSAAASLQSTAANAQAGSRETVTDCNRRLAYQDLVVRSSTMHGWLVERVGKS